MPRSLARLRYRQPPAPVVFSKHIERFQRTQAEHDLQQLEQRVASYVAQQSNPRHIKLQTIVNPKARPLATGQFHVHPMKPFTVQDVVDPEGTARHGEIIYIFRNTKSNQIIYSLQPLLNNHHLEQLPFIGKHSKPPVLRPDEWVPHCAVTFPTAEQGHNAYRKLREFRKLHEMAWDKTNASWKKAPLKQRMKKIMNQKANMSIDLAEVLRIQEEHGLSMTEARDKQDQEAKEFMDKRWAEIDELANTARAKEKVADNIKWLEHQVRSLTMKLNMKHNKNEADQRRLKNARNIQDIRLKKLQYAVRKAEQFKTIQAGLKRAAAPAIKPDAEGKLAELKSQATALREALANPDPTRTAEDLAIDKDLLARNEAQIARLETAFEAKSQLEARDHHIARSVLPQPMKKTLPTPYTLDGVRVQWVDMQDALHAAEKWPEAIEHEVLPLSAVRSQVALLSAEQFEIEASNEVSNIISALKISREPEELSA
ncbi:transcriptional regulation of mitochondrial recombination-domain-containing protein [Paraphoma chrysanthemicola]|uniref:Large ribosomal subunit protein mL67 n=1 Tax=Paraphoma chrysanthemicola TaxID=798071 RepID=A0A8K0RG05_9PLEO|nr:transcriptional regulation of mitochondrial recombination-domain-containing protein [Paraphoma chrysanthemicola]